MEREEFTKVLARLQEKDIKALEKLYNEYFGRVYSIALYEVKNRDDAYDLAMNVMMELCDYRGDPKQIKNPTGFVVTTTYHTIKDFFRRRKWRADTDVQTVEKSIEVDDSLWINDIMQQLTEEERYIFVNHVIWGRSLKDIAEEKNESYISLKRSYARIKERIRQLYK